MEKKRNEIKEELKECKFSDDLLSFEYFNYRLEALVRKIKSNKYIRYVKACK